MVHERPLRIGFLAPYYPPHTIGGMEVSLWHIAETVAREGHTVRVFTLNYGKRERIIEGTNPKVYRFPWPSDRRLLPTKNPWAVRKLAQLIVETGEHLDLLDTYTLFPHGIRAARTLGIRAVVSPRDASAVDRGALTPQWDPPHVYVAKRVRRAGTPFPELAYALYGLYLRATERRAIAKARLAIYQSNAQAKLFEGIHKQSAVIGSIALRKPIEGDPPAIAGIDFSRDRVVNYAGRLGEGKGVGVLLEAAEKLLHAGGERLKFLFLGTGPLEERIRRSPFFGRGIILSGRLPYEDTLRVVKASTVTVTASKVFEGYPRLAIESIALGTPVIGSTAGGIPEAVGEGGLIVPAGDADALAHAIRKVALDDAFRAQLLPQLKQEAEKSKPEVVAEKLLAAYWSML